MIGIVTERLRLRRPRHADAPSIRRIASDARVALLTASIPHPYPADGAEQFIRKAIADSTNLRLAIELRPGGQVVGMIGAQVKDKMADLAYMIDPDFWGRGIATEAATGVVGHLFAEHNVDSVVAGTMEGNSGSRRVLEKIGFEVTGDYVRELPVRGGSYNITYWRLTRSAYGESQRR